MPRSIEGAVRGNIGVNKFTIDLWDSQKSGYSDEYVEFVESAISDLRNVAE